MSTWEETLWAELDALPPSQRIVTLGDWIARITRDLLPELGRVRRLTVVEVMETEDMSAAVLADTIGSRPQTIARLAADGRSIRRQELAHGGEA